MGNYSRVAEGKTKRQFVLSQALDDRIRAQSGLDGTTITAFIIDAVEKHLAETEPPPRKRGRRK